MNVKIREATALDYNPLLELFDLVDALHRDNLPHIFQKPPGPARDRTYFNSLLSDEETALFIAEVENELVGFILALVRDTPPIPVFTPNRFVMVTDIAVKKDFRRKGIAHRLINKVHKWAKIRGASTVELNVYDFNQAAIDFYKTIGYETISLRMGFPLRQG